MRASQSVVHAIGPRTKKALARCKLGAIELADVLYAVRDIRESIKKIIKGPTTQHLYWDIILFIAENNLSLREVVISDIHAIGGNSKSTVTSAVKRLEKYKLLEIEKNIHDKRRKNVFITDIILSKLVYLFNNYHNNLKKIGG